MTVQYRELSLRCQRKHWQRVEHALEELGALSITLLDAHDDPILEPGPGETPLWPEIVANALFEVAVDERGLIEALRELAGPVLDGELALRDVEDADWTRAWMDQYQPMQFGRRLWIYPSSIDPPDAAEGAANGAEATPVIVTLDPGLAFGSGTHPTTAMCLEFLDALPLAGARVLDYGCGSGILAIAALKLGAASALGVDNDPQALVATRDNAERNAVAGCIAACEPGDARVVDRGFDVVVANILAGALTALAGVICRAAKPGAPIALSGILAEQADEVVQCYAAFCDALAVTRQGDWVRVSGIVRAA